MATVLCNDLPWHRQVVVLKATVLCDGLPWHGQIDDVTRWRWNLRKRLAKCSSHVHLKAMEVFDDLAWHRQVVVMKATVLYDGLPWHRQVDL